MATKSRRAFAGAFINRNVRDSGTRNFARTSLIQRHLDPQRLENIGDNTSIRYDGANRRIIINDGSNDRILIGYDKDGF